eukprot:gene7527-8363_t
METYDASIASKASSVSAADENEDYICDEHSKDTNCNHVDSFVVNQKPSVNTERLKDATIEIEKTEKLFSSSTFEMSQNEEKQMPLCDNNRDKELDTKGLKKVEEVQQSKGYDLTKKPLLYPKPFLIKDEASNTKPKFIKAPTLIVNANPGKEVLEKPKTDFESLKDNKEVTSQKEHLVVSLNDLDNDPEVAKSPACHEMLTENIKFQDKIVAQTTADYRMVSTSDVTQQEHGDDDKDSTEKRKQLMKEGMPFDKNLEQVEEACDDNNHLIEELKHDHSSSLQVYAGVIESENGPESSNVVIDEEGEEEFDFNSHEKKEKLENQNADTLNSFESCDAVLECSPKLSSTLGQRDAGLENVKENHFGMPNSCFSQEKQQIVKPRRPPPPVNLQKKKVDSQSEPFETIGAIDGNVNPAGFIQGPCLERRRRRLPKIPQSPLKSFETAPQQHESSTLSNKVSNFQHLIDKKDRISHGYDVDSQVKMPSNLNKVKEEERTKRNALKINRAALKVVPPVGRRIKTNADRISCPFPTATAEETLAAVHSRLNDKWKCRSLTVPDQQACDSSPPKGELFHYLEKQRKKTEAAKEELSQPEMKPNIDKMTGEEQEVEDAVLFDHVLVVKLKQGSIGLEPFISYRFPPKQTSEKEVDPRIASIPQFCFPDLRHGMSEQDYRELHAGYKRSETFSFVLTDMVGQRHFGYCRQIQISDSKTTTAHASPLPEVYCIVSPHGLFGLYSQILNEVEKQCEYSSTSVFSFLKAGHSLDIKFFSGGRHGFKSVTLYRAGDSAIHEHVDFKQLFDCLSVQMILHALSALLLERRILLVSSQLSLLSACCHAFVSLLYPFQWQHTYIPVLPHQLLDMCCLPTPYLLGALSGCLEDLEDLPLDDVIIIDLDNGRILRDDEGKNLSHFPSEIRNLAASSLSNILKKDADASVIISDNKERNMITTEIFIDVYLHLIGNFQENYSASAEDDSGFLIMKFVKSFKSKEERKFMKQFVKTQAFQFFIRQYSSDNKFCKGLFEKRLHEWQTGKKQRSHDSGWHRLLGKLKVRHR